MRSRTSCPIVCILLIAVGPLVLAGCAGQAMSRIDREVAHLLEAEQAQALGDSHPSDPSRVPPTTASTEPDDATYAQRPGTVNPDSTDLPATPDPDPADPNVMPPLLEAGEDVTQFDLEQVMAYAIGHSPEYRTEKEALFLAVIDLLTERHRWGPRFFATMEGRLSGTPEAGDNDQVLDLLGELGVTQRLPYGGSVTARALVSYVNTLRSELGTADDEQATSVALSLTVPLLRGAGMVAREDLIQSERDLVYAVRRFERFRRSFLVSVATSYFDLIRLASQIDNRRRQVTNFRRLADRFQALADAGREPYFEYERAEQQVLFARNNLLNAQERYASALDAFKITLGMPTTEGLRLAPTEPIVPELLLDAAAAVQIAHRFRLDLQTTQDRTEDARRQVLVARNQTLPDLDLDATVTVPTDPSRRYGLADLSLEDGSYTAGLTFDAPVDRRIEHLRYRRSLVELERSQRNHRLERDRIAREVRDAIRQIEQARFTLQLQERNVELAERRVIGVQLRERTLGPRDVIEAQEDLTDAENTLDDAERNLRVSILNYLLDTGQMRVDSRGQWLPPARLVLAIESRRNPAQEPNPEPDNARTNGEPP